MPRAQKSTQNARANPIGRPTLAQRGGRATPAQDPPPPITNYILHCKLEEVKDPAVILIIAFGWENRHLSQFTIFHPEESRVSGLPMPGESPAEAEARMAAVRARRGDGLIPRQPWSFQKEDTAILLPDIDDYDAEEMADLAPPGTRIAPRLDMTAMDLSDFFDDQHYVDEGATLMWEYDLGDGWETSISLMGKDDQWLRRSLTLHSSAEMSVICLSGEGRRVKEDCGGPVGWEELKLRNEENRNFNPYKWNIRKVNEALKAAQPFDVSDEVSDEDFY
ncbi:hypothetical protein F5Y16DRAFT_396208 [Xylariaceae sp. FL0255]|nr:hypothetical protein F5Y16DRAFT_396208 [Xylariaceae sp. FL0255]